MHQTVVRKKHKKVRREKRIAEARFRTQRDEILNNPSFSEKTCPISLLNQEFKRFANPHILTHKKKLFNLWKNQAVYCPNSIVNLSKKKLSLHITNLLMFGLNHPILPERVQKDKIKTNVEKLVYTLKRNNDVTVNEELRDEFKFLVKRFTNDAERVCSERANQSLYRTLRSLSTVEMRISNYASLTKGMV